MATHTAGTNANNSLTAVTYIRGIGGLLAADVATINNGIKDDKNPTHPLVPGAFSSQGELWIPRRGWLQIAADDVVCIDSRGWPILLSADTIANGPWTYT